MAINLVSGVSSQQLNVSSSVQTAVSAKVLQSQRSEGAAALKLLQAATLPSTGSNKNVDIKA